MTDPRISLPVSTDPTVRDWPPPLLVTPHFARHEFAQPAGYGVAAEPYPEALIEPCLRPLCEVLEVLRAELGMPLRIVSGWRSEAYNAAHRAAGHGAALLSQHCKGRAADVVADVSPRIVHATVLRLHQAGRLPRLGGLGRYATFTHLDVRPTAHLVQWDG